MASVFTRIIDGELPGHFVWSDDVCVAILSINPVTDGHALVIPRVEIDQWIDLDESLAAHLMRVAHKIGVAIREAFSPNRVGQLIAGFEVPHTHVHVIAVNDMGDMDLANSSTPVDHDELARFAAQLREILGVDDGGQLPV